MITGVIYGKRGQVWDVEGDLMFWEKSDFGNPDGPTVEFMTPSGDAFMVKVSEISGYRVYDESVPSRWADGSGVLNAC